jgi:UDP-N-acetylglucosamine--N-acetylmuramyl-(pentapeptide) pyrophosphoryl-undecaprenol N-acetylglucosamine transferase
MEKRVLLVFGGSLGARSINEAIEGSLQDFIEKGLYVIWQTGSSYTSAPMQTGSMAVRDNLRRSEFIDDMATAYAAADLVVSRSGATTVAELAVAAKPSVLVPLASAANNEQSINAEVFKKAGAPLLSTTHRPQPGCRQQSMRLSLMTKCSMQWDRQPRRWPGETLPTTPPKPLSTW